MIRMTSGSGIPSVSDKYSTRASPSSSLRSDVRLLEIRLFTIRIAWTFSFSVSAPDTLILSIAVCAVLNWRLSAKTRDWLFFRLIYPASSSAAMAVLTRVSISLTESSQPACRAISRAECDIVCRNLVKSLIDFQIWLISFWVSLVWFCKMKCLLRSSSSKRM